MAARGCYLCLRDAAAAYSGVAKLIHDPSTLNQRIVETDLMLALREAELRLPDSGARAHAEALRPQVKSSEPIFAALDVLAAPSVEALQFGTAAFLQRQRSRQEVLLRLETRWRASPVAAYFYLTLGRGSIFFRDFKQDPQQVADAHSQDAAVKYALLLYPQPPRTPRLSDELLAAEPRFAEVHLQRGQQALFGGDLGVARREIVAAREILPASLAVLSALAPVEFAYSHYAAALALCEEILAHGTDPQAHLGKAQSLSYLLRHREAIVELDDLLKDPSRNPGDKYYWRAWNKLQLAELQPAYDDATATLKFMNGPDAYRLAGISTFNLQRLSEARGYFDSALKMFAADCDSIQYIGQLDAAERRWAEAVTSFTRADGCFQESIARKLEEVAKKEADNSGGLLDDQIAGLKSEIESQRLLQAQSVQNATIAARNTSPAVKPGR
jgi:hypothetical protein